MEDSNCRLCIFIVEEGEECKKKKKTLLDGDVNLAQFSEMLHLCMEEEEGD